MKNRLFLLAIFACLATAFALSASADTLYENGPVEGSRDAWTINFGFIVSDTFTIPTPNSAVNGFQFAAWVFPGDVIETVEVSITSNEFGGTTYFDQQVPFTASGCFTNHYGFNVCTETGAFSGVNLAEGTYWINLQNAVVNTGDPVYWDENSGEGCHSQGCPSMASQNSIGVIPSETFSILGSSGSSTVPEPASLLLFGSGVAATFGILRRKLHQRERSLPVKYRLCLLAIFACLATAFALPAAADTLYENGPINGTVDGWTINFGFAVSDTFTLTSNSTVNSIAFGAWMFPGDVIESVEVSFTEFEFGGTTYLDQVVNLTASNCAGNQYGYNVCLETGNFTGVDMAPGTYWMTLQNAVVNTGDPVYWDENSGIGCHSEGCPSEPSQNSIGTIPAESFSVLGNGTSTTGTVPEPGSLLLLSSGVIAVGGILRGKIR